MGLVVGALVVAVVVCAERVLFRRPWTAIGRELGLGAALLLVIPVFLAARGAPASPHPGWPWLLPGLFAQAGVAEETLFRGYLFRHVRQGRTFGRAALVAAVPFVAVHLAMFLTLPWPIALASVVLAALISVPLAYLFELGGDTIWAPALVHFVVQGAIKLVDVPGEAGQVLPLVWLAASAVLPWAVFLVPRRR